MSIGPGNAVTGEVDSPAKADASNDNSQNTGFRRLFS
jgi:hypothetical protein